MDVIQAADAIESYLAQNRKRVLDALQKRSRGIHDYLELQTQIDSLEPLDAKFVQRYRKFYQMRKFVPDPWCEGYFGLFVRYRDAARQPEFGRVLSVLSRLKPRRIDPSFASKLVASLDPFMPVYDSNVLGLVKGLAPAYLSPRSYSKDRFIRMRRFREIYEQLRVLMDEVVSRPSWQTFEVAFDRQIPTCVSITSIKKLDLALWASAVKP